MGPLAHVTTTEAANPLLEVSPGLMIWTVVLFLLTLLVMKKYVFGPVGQAIEKRRAQIATSIDEAESSRDEALRLLEDYRQRLAEARKEADELRERGRREGERARQELVSTAEQQRDRILTDSRTQLDAQQRQAMSDIRDDVVGLALLAAERVTRKSLSDDDHRRLVEQALDESDLSALSRGG